MAPILAVVVLAVAIIAFRLATKRAVTIAELEIEDGVVRIVHGGIPAAVLNDIRDVVRDPPVRAATVRIVRAVRYARVEFDGEIPAGQAQQIQNVVGSVPLARLASARRA